jgi:hypothetical protein
MKMSTFLFFVLTYMSFAQNNKSDLLVQEVLAAQSTRINAMLEGDIDKLNTLLADDLTYAHTTGWTETKAGYLETIKSGNINYITFIPRNVNVRIYGETAVLTGKVAVNLGRTDFEIKFLEVQLKVNNQWQLVAWQSVLNKHE